MMKSADCASSQTLDPFQILSKIEILSKAYWKTFFFSVEPAMILWKVGRIHFWHFTCPKKDVLQYDWKIFKWIHFCNTLNLWWSLKEFVDWSKFEDTNFVLQRFDGNFFYQKCQCYFKLSLSVEVLFFS